MADLTRSNEAATILQIADGIADMISRLNDLRKAPQEIQDFKCACSTFGTLLHMFYEVLIKCLNQKESKKGKWRQQIEGLILQGEQVGSEMVILVKKLERNRGEGVLIDLKEWWENIIWSVFQKEPVKHLKLNMGTACAYMQSFVAMFTLDALELQWYQCDCAEEKKRLENQIASLRVQLKTQYDINKQPAHELQEMNRTRSQGQSREEREENRRIAKSAKCLNKSLRRRVQCRNLRSEPTSHLSNSNQSSELSHCSSHREHQDLPEAEPEPVQQPTTTNELWIPPVWRSDLFDTQQSMPSVPPQPSASRAQIQSSTSGTPAPIQAPSSRDKSFGPEESYDRWSDSVVHGREMEEELRDLVDVPVTNDSAVQTSPGRQSGKASADSVIEQTIGGSSRTSDRPDTAHLNPRENGSKKEGKRRESSAAGNTNISKSLERSKIQEPGVNIGRSDASRASKNSNRKLSRSQFRLNDELGSAETYVRRQGGLPRHQSTSGPIENGHEERSLSTAPKQVTAEVRAKLQDASLDYKKQKELKRLAEKRRRDTKGIVIGDPIEDDEFERKKKRGRGM